MINKKHCSGCRNDLYNHGFRGKYECWHLKDAKLIKHNDVPPWNKHPIVIKNPGMSM